MSAWKESWAISAEEDFVDFEPFSKVSSRISITLVFSWTIRVKFESLDCNGGRDGSL